MINVHSLVRELSSVEITCELTDWGESESIHRDERQRPGVNTRIWALKTLSKTRLVLGKMTSFRRYQTRASGERLFFFLYANSIFLEGCTNSEQFVKSEIGMDTYSLHSFIPFCAPVFIRSNSGEIPSTAT